MKPDKLDDLKLNKAQKLVRVLELLSRPGGIPPEELEAQLGVDPRTVRRYLADLRRVGVSVDEAAGPERLLSVSGGYGRAGVQLTLAEVLSLHFGRTLFTFLEGTTFAEDLDGAFERLQPSISKFNKEMLDSLDRKFLAVPEHAKDYREDADLLDEVVSALIHSNPADAEYRGARGQSRIYRLEPLTLATYRQGLYLLARDVAEGRIKTFALERFTRFARLRRAHFAYPEDYDPRAVLGDGFGITSGVAEEVVARFSPEVALYLRERRWHPSARVEVLGDGGVRLRMRVAVGPELKTWFLGFGAEVVVEAPPSLLTFVREAHVAAAARYR